ncbi:MAG: MinD/ParA family protein [Pseudomonadota bacterium]
MARIITITSGKGGVGKTSISLNLSLCLASKGYKVCLFDADLGLANVNILTGLYPKTDLADVIFNRSCLNDIMIKDFQGIDIIPGSNGVEKLADLTCEQTDRLIHAFLDLEDYDYFIFDTSAGISSQVIAFCMASHEIVLVATCEPTSITDAYSMLKTFSKRGYENPVKILINQVKTGKAAKSTYAQLKETVNRFLTIKLEPLGIVGWDKSVRMAVISQTPFFMLFPETLASKCIRTITEKLINKPDPAGDMPMELFWDKCLAFFEKKPALQMESPQDSDDRDNTISNPDSQENKTLEKDMQIQQAIARLESKLDALLDQVSEIRQHLEVQTPVLKKEPAPFNPSPILPIPALPVPRKITLDFESWLQENKRQGF